MAKETDKIIKSVYKSWKADHLEAKNEHPCEEEIACFLESKLSKEEAGAIEKHLVGCNACAEQIALQLQLKPTSVIHLPKDVVKKAKDIITLNVQPQILEIFLELKDNILKLLKTTGDVLLGQELVPAPVLRSRKITDFKDEVIILKDFKDIRAEVKIENKHGKSFDLSIAIKERPTLKILKDLRITLIKDDLELESYICDSGKVTFEHVLIGSYTIEVTSLTSRLAKIILEIKT